MLTRQLLRLPWFLSTPLLLAVALLFAVSGNRLAGVYFQRSFVNDVDPFAGLSSVQPAAVATQPAAADNARPSEALPMTVTPPSAPAAQATAPPSASIPAQAQAADAAAPAPAGPVLLAEGSFVDGDPGHKGKGTTRLIRGPDGASILRFEDFSVTNGPDLFVILSTDPSGSRGSAAAQEAVNLGRLRATDGNVNYAVPMGTDLSLYRSVIIYCRAFRTVFAVATLEQR